MPIIGREARRSESDPFGAVPWIELNGITVMVVPGPRRHVINYDRY